VGVVVILINSAIITKYGRRRVFLTTGMTICGFTQLVVAIVYDKNGPGTSTGKAIVGLSVIYIVGYNGLVATYAWLCAGEFPSQRLRSYTFGLAASIGFLGAWLATFTAPYFINPDSLNWGPKYGYIWFPSCLLGALWTWLYLPEVQNRTFEEIDEMVRTHMKPRTKFDHCLTLMPQFEARLPARKFRGYKCVGSVTAVAMAAKADGSEGSEKDNGSVTHREVILGNEKAAVETAIATT
jgi:MFS transporter, SP family, sugar:H+ symporter